jgi:hypothetical protein
MRNVFWGVLVLCVGTAAWSQNKVSGAAQCDKPDIQQQVEISDHPGHTLAISQMKCNWSKPMEVDGVQDKDGIDSGSADVHGGSGSSHGYYIDNMANGDKTFVHWQGTDAKDGTSQGKWTYTGGTGKFKSIKGGGTYKGKRAQDGSISFQVDGEYTLAK